MWFMASLDLKQPHEEECFLWHFLVSHWLDAMCLTLGINLFVYLKDKYSMIIWKSISVRSKKKANLWSGLGTVNNLVCWYRSRYSSLLFNTVIWTWPTHLTILLAQRRTNAQQALLLKREPILTRFWIHPNKTTCLDWLTLGATFIQSRRDTTRTMDIASNVVRSWWDGDWIIL